MRTLNENYPLYPVPAFSSVQEMLVHSAQAHGERLALVDLTATPIPRLSYAELLHAADRFGRALLGAGLEPRDHVAVIGENRVQWAVAYLACACWNLVVVPIDKSLNENEIVTILHASDAKAAVFSEHFRDLVATLSATMKGLRVLVDMDLPGRDGRLGSMIEMIATEPEGPVANLPRLDPSALAVIVFTSGAMGRAKGVMLSQHNIASNLRDMLSMLELLPSDRFLSVLPLHHTYECTCGLLCPLTAGASVHFARSLKSVVEDLQRVRATILLGVPMLYDKMYRRISAAIAEKRSTAMLVKPIQAAVGLGEAIGLTTLRRRVFAKVHERLGGAIRILIVGGAAPNPEVARGLRGLGFAFVQGYGLTETSPILALNRLRKFKDDAAGVPLPNVEIRIEQPDDEGRGEIVVRGPSVMMGYYKNEEATRAVLADGWFSTGDLGWVDDDGFLHVSGRKKNVIVASNGKNVFPEELEDEVNRLPFVLESVVYGARSASGDEEICALIVPNAEEVLAHAEKHAVTVTREWLFGEIDREVRELNRRWPLYKQIRRVALREGEFDKTTTQKIKRYLVHQEESTH